MLVCWICWSGPWAFYFLFGWWRFSFVFLLCFVTSIWLACCRDLCSFFFFCPLEMKASRYSDLGRMRSHPKKKTCFMYSFSLCPPLLSLTSFWKPISGAIVYPQRPKKKIGIAISAFGERWDSGKSRHPSSSFSVLFFVSGIEWFDERKDRGRVPLRLCILGWVDGVRGPTKSLTYKKAQSDMRDVCWDTALGCFSWTRKQTRLLPSPLFRLPFLSRCTMYVSLLIKSGQCLVEWQNTRSETRHPGPCGMLFLSFESWK